MAITFPRALQDCKFTSVTFELQRAVSRNLLYGGQTQVREAAEPRWFAELTTQPLSHAEVRAWRAWWDSLRGGVREILLYDPYSPYPAAYRSGFGGLVKAGTATPFDGTASVTAVTANTISLSGLPAGFVLSPGDYTGLWQASRFGLYRNIEDAVANSSGVLTITVEPSILTTLFSAGAVAYFARPVCAMNVIADSWSAPRGIEHQPVSFRAIQNIMATGAQPDVQAPSTAGQPIGPWLWLLKAA